ncbi:MULTISPECIES: hypothetical protein [Corynebacterium]|jgi:hypothetical protein|uniref:FCS-type domain-containing protein n=1 Tax=Corynebacterium provencense TaxID=1737425 RepID=A0A2Z3YY20_9CORY|nr:MULTISPECIES: hypothetical protein [Corynebacterium]AWT26233.1 hypothetical protein Csp1_14440 [Corynebacterium provencense]MCI1257006.1 hypothetical protein [Corynebacterium provencense]
MLPHIPDPSHRSSEQVTHCAWCGREVTQSGSGRRRRYCGHSCRQRAYEQRRDLAGTSVPADALILPRAAAEELTDRLFELRCSAEDVAEAVAAGEDAESVGALCRELVDLARAAEKIRGRVDER